MNQEQNNLLKRLAAEDFALYEVVLYLDAYPTNKKALAFYEQHAKAAQMLRSEYEQKYGPLTVYGNNDTEKWQWTTGPWPWEKEAN